MTLFQSELASKRLHRYMKPSSNFSVKTGNTPQSVCISCKQPSSKIIDSLPDRFKKTKLVKNPETKLMEEVLVTPRPLIDKNGFCPVCQEQFLVRRDLELIQMLQDYCGYNPSKAVARVTHGIKKD